MKPRFCATLIALLGSLSLAVPAAWAQPTFGNTPIPPVVFAKSPGSSCSPPTNSVTLPTAHPVTNPRGTGTYTYTLKPFTGSGRTGLPTGITFDATTKVLTGATGT